MLTWMISSFLFNLYLYRVFVCLTSAVVVHHQIKLFCIDDDDDVIGIFFFFSSLLRPLPLLCVCIWNATSFFFVICLIFDFDFFCVIIWLNMTLMSLLFHHFFVSLIFSTEKPGRKQPLTKKTTENNWKEIRMLC